MDPVPTLSRLGAAALWYAEHRGWRVFPLHSIRDGQCSCARPECKSPGKHPRIARGCSDATTDPAQVVAWWSEWPDAHVGVATGQGLTVIDIDPRHGGDDGIVDLKRAHGALPDTLEVLTGSGGRHIYLRTPLDADVRNSASALAPGVDVRGEGGYVVAPPSGHVSGGAYAWEVSSRPDDIELGDAPQTWLDAMRTRRLRAIKGGKPDVKDGPIAEGGRNDALMRRGCYLRAASFGFDAMLAALQVENDTRCVPPLDPAEVKAIVASVMRYPPGFPAAKSIAAEGAGDGNEAAPDAPAEPDAQPEGAWRPLTDLGNAERLADGCRDKLRWVDGLEWLVWDGRRWKRDTSYEVQRIAVARLRRIATEAGAHPDGEKAVIRHALKSESANGIANALKLLRGLPGIAHPIGDFDRDPWLLNCENGTLDLRTGTLRPHSPADLITKLAPVAWDPGADAPEFDAFLARVQPDTDVRGYLQRLVGYAATGVIREHVFPIWYGSGRNGKGTLTDAVRAALGDYATDVPAEMLTVRKNDAHPTERMCLLGARFASASETEGNTALAVAFVKRATGGDPITARHMGKDFVTFEPTHKIVLSTNNRPRIREGSDAIWRRVHLVPWEVQIPEGEVDAGLRDRLREDHRAAVLRWIVDGCLAWQRQGLAPPARVVAATRAYREDSEPDVLAFLRERCVLEAEARISRKELLGALNGWLAEDGSEPVSAKLLGDYVAENAAALRITRTTYGPVKVFKGVRLKTHAELTADAHEPDDRAHETSGSSIGLKTQVPVIPDDSYALSPMSPIHPPRTHTHAPAQAPALRAHAHPGPTWNRSGSSGSCDLNARNERDFSLSPIESANRAHRAQGVGETETSESMDGATADDLDDGNGALWTTEGDA